MARCIECNSVITKMDSACYICAQPVPGANQRPGLPQKRREKQPKPAAPVTPLSNVLFIASLVLTVVSFVCGQKMSLSFSATLSGILLIARVFSDRMAARQQLALRPVTVTRLHH
jgi:hypothetical protein